MISPDVFLTILKIAAVFIGVSFIVFWVGLVWWVAQDVLSRTEDKVIIAAAVAMTAILGPVGALLYLVIRPKQTLQESMGEMMEREMLLHASSTTICPTCGRMALEDFLSCPHCATQLKEHCPQCQKLVSVEWSHCPYCAAKLQPKRAPLVGSQKNSLRSPESKIEVPIKNADTRDTEPNDIDQNVTRVSSNSDFRLNSAISRTQALTKASASAVHQSTKTSLSILKDVFNGTRSGLPSRRPYADGNAASVSPAQAPSENQKMKATDIQPKIVEAPASSTSAVNLLTQNSSQSITKTQALTPSSSTRRPKNQRGSKK